MNLVSLEGSGIWVNASELDIVAEVVAAVDAKEAVAARNTRLDSDSITYFLSTRVREVSLDCLTRLEVFHALAASDNDASRFVTNNAIAFENKRSNSSSLPEMDIGATRHISCRCFKSR